MRRNRRVYEQNVGGVLLPFDTCVHSFSSAANGTPISCFSYRVEYTEEDPKPQVGRAQPCGENSTIISGTCH